MLSSNSHKRKIGAESSETSSKTIKHVNVASSRHVKKIALASMVETLQFERDYLMESGHEMEQENVGALCWKDHDNKNICCGITNVMCLITEDALLDFEDSARQYTTEEHSKLHEFPDRLDQLAQRLRKAADYAEKAGFDDFPDSADYTIKNKWLPKPCEEKGISVNMRILVDKLNIGRFINEDIHNDMAVGNLAWEEQGITLCCPISSVLYLIEEEILLDSDDEMHMEFIQDYGSLNMFPLRLRQLANRLDGAADLAITLDIDEIPDGKDEDSEDEEKEDEDQE